MDAMGMDYDMDITPITNFSVSTEDEFPPLETQVALTDVDLGLMDTLPGMDYDMDATPIYDIFSTFTWDEFSVLKTLVSLEDVDYGLMDSLQGMNYSMDTMPSTVFSVSTWDEFLPLKTLGCRKGVNFGLLDTLQQMDHCIENQTSPESEPFNSTKEAFWTRVCSYSLFYELPSYTSLLAVGLDLICQHYMWVACENPPFLT